MPKPGEKPVKMTIVPKIEPVRKTMHDVMKFNIKQAGRVIYLHRIIYIGRHTFPMDASYTLKMLFEKIIKDVHSWYYDERLTGILLYYPAYFCHIIEGSEDSLFKHFRLLLSNEISKEQIGELKVLVYYHHMNQRFRDDWIAYTAKPQTLLEKLDMDADMEKSVPKIKKCIEKLYNLGIELRPKPKPVKEPREGSVSSGEEEEEPEPEPEDPSTIIVSHDCLPEYGLLEFLLQTQYTRTVKYFCDLYGKVPVLMNFKDPVWPSTTDFVPMHIFDEIIDPITDISLEDTI